jgi:CRISPR-associated protein Cas5h
MQGLQLKVSGNWGHFKKPETNNNPLTHDFITKTAFIGLIGAVLGIEREKMLPLFPQLSEDFLYGVSVLHPVRKLSWGFTSSSAVSSTRQGSPKSFEFLKNPSFKISLALGNERSSDIFEKFREYVTEGNSIYTPVLGWHNCPASLEFISSGTFSKQKEGDFSTQSFVETDKKLHRPKLDVSFRVGFERIPTYQENFWNLPEKYKTVIYPAANSTLNINGKYFEYSKNQEKWWLI